MLQKLEFNNNKRKRLINFSHVSNLKKVDIHLSNIPAKITRRTPPITFPKCLIKTQRVKTFEICSNIWLGMQLHGIPEP